MKKRGRIAVELLIILVVMVFTSALILVLVKSGVIEVRSDISSQPVLNAEFLPGGRIGSLVIINFEFCNFVDDEFNCFETKETFSKGENVYIRFLVESTTYNGDVLLVRNYEIRDPFGETVLQIDQSNSYSFEIEGREESERAVFADYFVLDEDATLGEYTLDIIVENPLLEKRITQSEKFRLVE